MRCEQKVPYPSQMLAANAAWLHRAVFTGCAGVSVYRCPSCRGWHFGHATHAASEACRSVTLPPRHRPARVVAGRRYDSARAKVRRRIARADQ